MGQNVQPEASFEEALLRYKKMLASSRYATHLHSWCEAFGRENVLVVLNDDLATNSQDYVNGITEFIGIPKVNVSAVKIARIKTNTIATAPRSARLAREARRLRSWLGSRRMYRIRGLLGKAGVWRICFE